MTDGATPALKSLLRRHVAATLTDPGIQAFIDVVALADALGEPETTIALDDLNVRHAGAGAQSCITHFAEVAYIGPLDRDDTAQRFRPDLSFPYDSGAYVVRRAREIALRMLVREMQGLTAPALELLGRGCRRSRGPDVELVDCMGRGGTVDWQVLYQRALTDGDLRRDIQRALPLVDPDLGADREIWADLLGGMPEISRAPARR